MRIIIVSVIPLFFQCSKTFKKNHPNKIKLNNAFEYYAASVDSFSSQSFQSALSLIQNAIILNPNFAKFHQLQGDIYYKLDNPGSAINSYIEVIKRRSNSVNVHIKIADIYEKNKLDYSSAIKFYRRALALDKSKSELLLNIGACYLANNEIDVALFKVNEYKKLIQTGNHPLIFEYFFLSGQIYSLKNMYEKSIEALINAVRQEPNHFQAKLLLTKSLFKVGKFEEGLNYTNELLKSNDQVGDLYFFRGLYYFNKGKYQDAFSLFERALDLDEKIFIANYYLGRIYEELKDYKNAVIYYQKYRKAVKVDDLIIDVDTRVDKIRDES